MLVVRHKSSTLLLCFGLSTVLFCLIKTICCFTAWVHFSKYFTILFYITLFYDIIYSNIIIVVLHIYNNIKSLGIQFLCHNFCYIFKFIDCEHYKKAVTSCQSNDLSTASSCSKCFMGSVFFLWIQSCVVPLFIFFSSLHARFRGQLAL